MAKFDFKNEKNHTIVVDLQRTTGHDTDTAATRDSAVTQFSLAYRSKKSVTWITVIFISTINTQRVI